jgi:hypothetical protein
MYGFFRRRALHELDAELPGLVVHSLVQHHDELIRKVEERNSDDGSLFLPRPMKDVGPSIRLPILPRLAFQAFLRDWPHLTAAPGVDSNSPSDQHPPKESALDHYASQLPDGRQSGSNPNPRLPTTLCLGSWIRQSLLRIARLPADRT